ncbi:hypothetical protein ACFLRU_00665 [Bacteroidota bacterium]
MKKLFFFLIPLSIFFSACHENENILIDENNLLIGSWSYPEYSDNKITYSRVATTIQDEYTCTFKKDGSIIEHKNAGWCGTPPITYDEFVGKWNYENEETIHLETAYWGGISDIKWEILAINQDKLTVVVIHSNL